MEELNKNEAPILPKYNNALTVPKVALGAPTTKKFYSSSEGSGGPPTAFRSYYETSPNYNTSSGKVEADRYKNVELNEISIGDGDDSYHLSPRLAESMDSSVASLPSLDKVLSGESGAPLSRYNFYCYLREQWQAEDNLNFWLDVANHENLWKTWLDNERKKKEERELLYKYDEKEEFDESEDEDEDEDVGEERITDEFELTHSDSNEETAVDSRHPVSPLGNYGFGGEQFYDLDQQLYRRQLNEEDLHKSAKKIYRKYAHLNIFPEEHRITMEDLILRQGRHNPVVFSSSKSYVYHIMNVIFFPKFIDSSIEMNLSQVHSLITLPLGMLSLTCGIALELYYIFMALENRMIRLWAFLPIWLGWILLQTAVTRFLPLLTLFGVSEHRAFRFQKINEKAILNAHRSRAFQFFLYDTLVSALSVAILLAIPPIPLNS